MLLNDIDFAHVSDISIAQNLKEIAPMCIEGGNEALHTFLINERY